jgi:hypothetical protein
MSPKTSLASVLKPRSPVRRICIPSSSEPVVSRTSLPQSADLSKSVGTVSTV